MDCPENVINIIKNVFHISGDKILDMKTQKKGMTNRSITFSVDGKTYIFRMPGEGTDLLIN